MESGLYPNDGQRLCNSGSGEVRHNKEGAGMIAVYAFSTMVFVFLVGYGCGFLMACRATDGILNQPTEQVPDYPAGMRLLNETIFEDVDAANDALPKCPRPKAGADGGHWWYCECGEEFDGLIEDHIVLCVCGTCGGHMKLSADAQEYPL
jgi:hypothetical protein